jgi:hypothetical protein
MAANTLNMLPFVKVKVDEEEGGGGLTTGEIMKPDAAVTIDHGGKRGSVTTQPLLGRAQSLEDEETSPSERPDPNKST